MRPRLLRITFQPGMSWRVIDAKWPGSLEAFDRSDPRIVAAYSPDRIDELSADTRRVRNRKKVEAAVHNAGVMVAHDDDGGFEAWPGSLGDYATTAKTLRKSVVSQPVPPYEEVFGRPPG